MRTAAITMVWNDNWFLSRWLRYFGKELGRENLYVVLHGEDEDAREIAKGCNVICIPRDDVGIDFDADRWAFLSRLASGLGIFYNTVVTLDVDEILIPTKSDRSLVDCLCLQTQEKSFCVPGFELFANTPGQEDHEGNESIAAQSSTALFSPFYSKACISKGDIQFSPGGHGLLGEFATLRTDLALLHLRFVNTDELNRRRMLRESIADEAYDAHGVTMQEMRRTGRLVSWKEARRRHRSVFDQVEAATILEWDDIIAQIAETLPTLRLEHDGRYQFRPKAQRPVKTILPSWVADRF